MRNIFTIVFLFTCLSTYGQLIKFSELPAANAPGGTEIVPGVQSGVNRKISLNQIKVFVWDLTPTIATNDTIGYVLVRRTSDGKVFKRSVSSIFSGGAFLPLTFSGNNTVDADGNNLTFNDLGTTTWVGSGGTSFTDTGGILYSAGSQDIEFVAGSGTRLDIKGSINQSTLSGGSGGVIIGASGGSNVAINATGVGGSGDITLDANDDIDIDPVDDLLISGVAGLSNQVISNTNGHPEWVDLNFWPLSGTDQLTGHVIINGASFARSLTYTELQGFSVEATSFNVDATNSALFSTPIIELDNGATGPASLRFREDLDNGIHYIGISAPSALAGNTPYTLPDAYPSSTGFVLSSTTAGVMSWVDNGGAAAGHVIEDEGTPLTQRANMNFTGAGVSVADAGGVTVVTIPAGTSPGGADTQVQYNDGGAFNAEADMAYNETTNTLTVDVVAVDAEVYNATNWDSDLSVPTKNDVRDKIETLGGSAHVIEDEGTAVTQRSNMTFNGGGVSVADSGGKTVVTVAGAGTKPWEFNVVDYGAVGNNSTDDTGAFQAAFTAAIAYVGGVVIIPRPSAAYKITSTINIVPASGAQCRVNVWAPGFPGDVSYQGGNNTALFHIEGLKDSNWTGLAASIATGRTGCVVIDIDTDASQPSTSFNTFKDFYLNLGGDDDAGTAAGRNEDCIGIRTGFVSGGSADISNYNFENISVFGGNDQGEATTPCLGQYAFQNLGMNCLSMAWYGGFVNNCDRVYSNINRAGSQRGNGSVFFYGLGASSNNIDFTFAFEQTYLIDGGRFEVGNKFLQVVDDPGLLTIGIRNVVVSAYADDDDIVNIGAAAALTIENSQFIKASGTYTSVIQLTGNNNFGSMTIENSAFSLPSTVPHPFLRSGNTTWRIKTVNNLRTNGSVFTTSHFPNVNIFGNTLDLDASDSGNVGAGEDVLYTYTLPAGTLNTDEQTLHIRVAGSMAANANAKRLRLKFGATNIVDPGTGTVSGTWVMDCQVIRLSNTTQKCNCTVDALVGSHVVLSDMTSTLSSTVVIQLTGEAISNNDIVKESVKVNLED